MLNGCAYILTVDVGNTFIRFGLFAEDSAAAQECPLATCEITTPSSITADEARMRLVQVMAALAADAGMPGALVSTAAVLSCVVPALERPWKAALSRTCTGRVLTVGPGLKTGMPVHYDDPAEIGPDRIADAVAARAVYGSPCIVIDLGTTTNIEVIDAHGTFVGGVIAPGLALGARSLSAAAARLPQVEPSALNDDFFPWGTSDDPLQDKHNYVVHAEANAVLNYRGSLKDLEGSTVYVTLFPCHDCAKILAQVGVGEVVYLDNKYADTDDGRISRRILDSCGISYRQVIVDVQIGTGGQAQQ